ncbi:hypothetical protein DFO67_1348 [Modicisalibacter xianhensis]|uniref:dATP/dGTP diphosphohydrolase N-terminal domain-containing protein n=1 Tax=Modicisalibacter xianhensis TaxID=442341 RepID=A0A4R8F7T7_9GAMM|nr:dATP/dGTP diphosphohydrolase domain-containing protein [Halomonas xianhensis]TDX21640.1 hypothetical protein DFO67_1348 [Halomonas xianhensis]
MAGTPNRQCTGCGAVEGDVHAPDCTLVNALKAGWSRLEQSYPRQLGDIHIALQGQKFDTDKPLMSLLPPHAQLAVARVLTFGARKYAPDNWRRVDDLQRRYLDAALRHLNAVQRGETDDAESGEHHYAHAICCLMFMLEDALLAEANQ